MVLTVFVLGLTTSYQQLNNYMREVVAQLVESSAINLLACASVGSNPVTATLCL